jgi:hypothetical protein
MNDGCHINDVRSQSEFKGIAFSGYRLCEVTTELIKSLLNTKVEDACYWSAELICSGHLKELWNSIITYYSKHINTTNPKLSVYLHTRFNNFITILSNDCGSTTLLLRNNCGMRTLVSEIMCVLCESKHGLTLTDIRISVDEFECMHIKDKLRAPNVSYLENVFFPEDDPTELFIAVNELCFQLSPDTTGGVYTACYWIEWIMEYYKYCKSKNQKCNCMRRINMPVDTQYQLECIWLIWAAIKYYVDKKEDRVLSKIIDSLLGLYCIGYTGVAIYNKRKYLIYCAVNYLFCPASCTTEMISENTKNILPSVKANINKIYMQIKKNEQSPKTDYLFSNLSKTSKLELTLNKIKMVNDLHDTIL